ncbi:MAG: HD domain-containing protein [bacterium]|nr:HD domain-containing protein [bacterium]
MRYHDLVYGNFNISEPVILKLINSPAFRRLKGVNQYGYGPLLVKPNINFKKIKQNRYTHSLGVYILLNKFKAPLHEQISGLAHDISHSAFSHSAEFAFDRVKAKQQKHQDDIHHEFISKTDIPKILKKFGINWKNILEDDNFPLKEKVLPDLCADRIDYLLRDGIIFEVITPARARELLKNLTAENGKWLFKGLASAKKFAKLFYTMNKNYYSDLSTSIMFAAVGDYLKYALGRKYITINDLYTTDSQVLAKIKKHLKHDARLNLLWLRMNGKIKARQNRKNYDAHIYCKSRVVDPLFLRRGKITRLSQALPGWRKIVKQELKPKEYFLKFEK